MIISYPTNAGGQIRPTVCRCGKRHFHSHGSYQRKITHEWILRFICTICRHTVSMVPNTCVPFKHHPTTLIGKAVHGLLHGQSAQAYRNEIDRATAYRWVAGFRSHASVLATEGARRLGIPPLSGSLTKIHQGLSNYFSEDASTGFFRALQVHLCHRHPPIGIFRTLIS